MGSGGAPRHAPGSPRSITFGDIAEATGSFVSGVSAFAELCLPPVDDANGGVDGGVLPHEQTGPITTIRNRTNGPEASDMVGLVPLFVPLTLAFSGGARGARLAFARRVTCVPTAGTGSYAA